MSLSYYETMYILRPDLAEEQVSEIIDKYRDFLSNYGVENLQIQNRGKRRLAYPINDHLDGIYVQMNYNAEGAHVAPMERSMRLSEEVIRYLTMKQTDKPGDTEAAEAVESDAEEVEVSA